MDRKKGDKRNSLLDKVGAGLRLGKEKKHKSVSNPPRQLQPADDHGFGGYNGDPFSEPIDVEAIAEYEVNERFEQMLDDMNLTEEKKAPLRARDLSFKRNMLSMQIKGTAKSRGGELDSPQRFVQELRNPELKGERRLRVLESLRVSLTSKPVSWVIEFGEKGLNAILRNLTYCCDNKTERRSTYECVRCLKAYMNNKFGLKQILDHEEALTILSRTVDPADLSTMLEAIRLLAAMCLVPPNGHEKALEGITVCGEIRGQERFVPIIMGLGMRDNPAMQVACVQLVNAIISTPDDLDLRLHLRNEIMRTGMNDLIGFLDMQDDEELRTHLNIFHEHKEEDMEEFSHRYDNIRMELDDAEACFKMIASSVRETVAEPYFLSILQHLLSIRDDVFARPQYYKLIEECVTQIVLHRSGVDPDFRHTKRFEIEVEPLLSSLSEKSKFEDSEVSMVEMNSKLDHALTAKQESEAKVAGLESKVSQYEAELNDLKTKISQGIGATVSASLVKQQAGGGVPPAPPPPGGGPPPPPPPPPGGGPPPPPPPPPPPGMGPPPPPPPPPPGGGPPPPPPPPGGAPRPPGAPPAFSPPTNQLPHGMKGKKKYELKNPTKRLNWNKLNAKQIDKQSLWVKANETMFEDIEMFLNLETMFSTKAPVKKESTEAVVKPTKKGKELRVLDPKAGQNLSILLGSIKVPYKEIKRRILTMDQENLTAAMVEQLIKNMPLGDSMNQLAAMKDQYDELAEPEQFAIVMSSIKKVHQRLESMLFQMRFQEMVDDIKPDLVSATEACEEVMKSERFKQLLELVLLMGNYLNTGSRNAQSIGFDVSFLPKLENTKSQDGSITMLHFLAQVIDDKHPDILGFIDETIHTEKAARVSMEMLQKNLKQMEKQVKQVELDVKTISKGADEDDRFPQVMKEFLGHAKGQHDLLASMMKRLENLHKDLGKYLSFDIKKYALEEFFGDLKTFKDGLQRAMKENAKMRETQEKIRRAREAKEKAEREKKEKKARQKAILDMTTELCFPPDDDQEGVMDNLLEALKTGSAFNVNREKRDGKRRTPRAAGAERRAQLARTRSRQDLLNLTGSTVREIDLNESHTDPHISSAPPQERVRRPPKDRVPDTSGASEAEQLLARLKQL